MQTAHLGAPYLMMHTTMASLYAKIKKMLTADEACAITKHGVPEYAVMRWEVYEEFKKMREEHADMRAALTQVAEEEEDIDINRIPV